MRILYKYTITLFFVFTCIFPIHSSTDVKLSSLKVEYEVNPIGIDVIEPRFSWQMNSDRFNQVQTAYQIIVKDENGDVVWNTNKVLSDISLNIKYLGKPLKATTRYNWTLRVWNQDNKVLSNESWFETGLMDSSISAWEGAKWIGGGDEDLVLHPDYLPAFNINYKLQLDKESGSTKVGFIFGANDPRLMNKNLNLYNLQSDKDESYIEIEIDISQLAFGKNALINVYRVGYSPNDNKYEPLKTFTISTSLINDENKYNKHTIFLKTMYSNTEIYLNGEDESNKIGLVTINPIGNSWDYICFPLLCDIGFSAKSDQVAIISDLEVRNYRTPNNVLFSEDLNNNQYKSLFSDKNGVIIKDRSYIINGADSGIIATTNIAKKSMPMLRTTFESSDAKISKARLYITSRGVYEIYLNGERIGDDYFNPGLTQYNKHHLYQTYDITNYIKNGDNAIGVIMGEGWWSGAITYMGYLWNLFGDRQSILAKLVINYEDGSKKTIISNPDTWTYFDNGPIVYSSFFQGEVYDARKEYLIDKWSKQSYKDTNWKKAHTVNIENEGLYDKEITINKLPSVNDFTELKLIGQFGQTVKKVEELTAISMEEIRPGVYVYDMGQNMVGIPQISLKGELPGKEIKLRYAEVKYPDLTQFKDNVGMIMLENIRGALAQDIYITKGGEETIKPHFTFHGYRFIEITGIEKPLPLNAVKGIVLSSIHNLTANYETSNPKVNSLWKNITWSMLGNFLSIPTDCPQRNERMGWSGDISVFSRTATYLGEIPQFLSRHLMAMRDIQREDGRFPDVAPVGGGFGGVLWGSAGITVAWESYQQYNDVKMISDHYDAMKSYIKYLNDYLSGNSEISNEVNLGDWLGPEQQKNDNTLLWKAYFIYDLEIMHNIAKVLNLEDDEKWFNKLYDENKKDFNNMFFNRLTGETINSGFIEPTKKGEVIGTVTSYILPLAFNICDEEIKPLVINKLIDKIENEQYINENTTYPQFSLMTGFIGTAWINRVFSDLGYSDTAYKLLQQTSYPSWLYSVEQGATTIWERLNSYSQEDGFGGRNSMNSFNHYSFGSIGSWMINYSIGINRDEKYPGFKQFILQPQIDSTGEMTKAEGYYDSLYGRIESGWEIKGDKYEYRFKVPANTSAILYMPFIEIENIKLNDKTLDKSDYIEILGKENGLLKIKLNSGKFKFKVSKN